MADLVLIGKAKTASLAMERITGVAPDMDIQSDYIRLYYPKNKIAAVQRYFERALNSKDKSDLRIEYLPAITPALIKKFWLYPALIAGLSFMIGRMSK